MDWRTTLANDVGDLGRLSEEAHAFLGRSGVPPKAAYAVELALEEVVTNVIKYAFDDAAAHIIAVSMSIDDEKVLLRVEDDGREFDPLSAPEPQLGLPVEERPIGGLGLHLVRNMVDQVDYRRENGRNSIEMRVDLAARREA